MINKTAGRSLSITLVRHGQTAWNAGAVAGQQDEQLLTPLGEEQIRRLANVLRRQPQYDYVVSSTLERAVRSATILRQELSITAPLQQNPLLVERNYGQQQPLDKTVTPGNGYNPFLYPQFVSLPDSQKWFWKPYGDFESDNNIIQRYNHFSQEILATKHKNILCVTHAGFIRAVVMHYGYIGYEDWNTRQIGNASAYKLEYSNDAVTITPLTAE